MDKNISTSFIDEMIVLSVLEDGQADAYDISDKISFLTGGSIKFNIRYAGLLLFRLKEDKYVKRDNATYKYSLTEKGADAIKERLLFFDEYADLVSKLRKEKETPKISKDIDFEGAFSDFIDRSEYDHAENALFSIVRSAFVSGWKTAGGKPPKSRAVLELVKPKK